LLVSCLVWIWMLLARCGLFDFFFGCLFRVLVLFMVVYLVDFGIFNSVAIFRCVVVIVCLVCVVYCLCFVCLWDLLGALWLVVDLCLIDCLGSCVCAFWFLGCDWYVGWFLLWVGICWLFGLFCGDFLLIVGFCVCKVGYWCVAVCLVLACLLLRFCYWLFGFVLVCFACCFGLLVVFIGLWFTICLFCRFIVVVLHYLSFMVWFCFCFDLCFFGLFCCVGGLLCLCILAVAFVIVNVYVGWNVDIYVGC